MLFSSIPFLYYFLPLLLVIYFLVPKKGKNPVLLIASLFFYFYGEPVYVLLMIGACLSAYIHGLLIHRFRGSSWSKVFLWSSVITSLSLLGFFKYSDFFLENLNALAGLDLGFWGWHCPLASAFIPFKPLAIR